MSSPVKSACQAGIFVLLLISFPVPGIAQQATTPPSPQWVATFEASPATYLNIPPPPGIPEPPGPVTGTLRYRFGISMGGFQIVVRLSNELGDKPLKIAGASISIAGDEMNAVPGTDPS